MLREAEGRTLGVIRTSRWVEADGSREDALRADLGAVLDGEGEPVDTRAATLVALASTARFLPKAFPGRDADDVARRGREVAESEWAGGAVREALRDMTTVVVASAAAALAGASATA